MHNAVGKIHQLRRELVAARKPAPVRLAVDRHGELQIFGIAVGRGDAHQAPGADYPVGGGFSAPKLQLKLASRSPGKRMMALVISPTSANRFSPLRAVTANTSVGSSWNR